MKVAFMTMDVESFYDIECFKGKNVDYNKEYSCEEAMIDYVHLLDKYNIKHLFECQERSVFFPLSPDCRPARRKVIVNQNERKTVDNRGVWVYDSSIPNRKGAGSELSHAKLRRPTLCAIFAST